MSKYTFTVNENSSEEAAKSAVTDLRRMARYGRLAEKALKSIQSGGYYDKMAPMLTEPEPDWNAVHRSDSSMKATVRLRKFPKKLEISRSDLAPFKSLRTKLGKTIDSSHGGHPNKEVELWLEGPIRVQTLPSQATYDQEDVSVQIGCIRINKGSISWLQRDSPYGSCQAFRVYRNLKHEGAENAVIAFAKTISKKLCVHPGVPPAAKTLDLQNGAWEWLIDDGIAESLFAEIYPAITISQIMES